MLQTLRYSLTDEIEYFYVNLEVKTISSKSKYTITVFWVLPKTENIW